jgi:hypothetical protein
MIPLNVGRVIRNSIRNSKVNKLQRSLHQHKVGWLEVRVDDLLVVDDLDRFEHLRYGVSVFARTHLHIDEPVSSNTVSTPYRLTQSAAAATASQDRSLHTP